MGWVGACREGVTGLGSPGTPELGLVERGCGPEFRAPSRAVAGQPQVVA